MCPAAQLSRHLLSRSRLIFTATYAMSMAWNLDTADIKDPCCACDPRAPWSKVGTLWASLIYRSGLETVNIV